MTERFQILLKRLLATDRSDRSCHLRRWGRGVKMLIESWPVAKLPITLVVLVVLLVSLRTAKPPVALPLLLGSITSMRVVTGRKENLM
jgi:hypothetical protein